MLTAKKKNKNKRSDENFHCRLCSPNDSKRKRRTRDHETRSYGNKRHV